MTSDEVHEWWLQRHRARVRAAVGDRTSVTPRQVHAALGATRTYDAEVAELVCGHLAALGFTRDDHGVWHQA